MLGERCDERGVNGSAEQLEAGRLLLDRAGGVEGAGGSGDGGGGGSGVREC